MKRGEFYTYIQIDKKRVAVKKDGFIDDKLGIGYYKYSDPIGSFYDTWFAIDLNSGLSIADTRFKKDIKNALMKNWDRLTSYKLSKEYQEHCKEFSKAKEAE